MTFLKPSEEFSIDFHRLFGDYQIPNLKMVKRYLMVQKMMVYHLGMVHSRTSSPLSVDWF